MISKIKYRISQCTWNIDDILLFLTHYIFVSSSLKILLTLTLGSSSDVKVDGYPHKGTSEIVEITEVQPLSESIQSNSSAGSFAFPV